MSSPLCLPSSAREPRRLHSLTQRVQSISRLLDAAGKSLGIEFLCLGDVALRAEGSPCRKDERVVRLRQREQRRRAARLGGTLEHDPRRADIALAPAAGWRAPSGGPLPDCRAPPAPSAAPPSVAGLSRAGITGLSLVGSGAVAGLSVAGACVGSGVSDCRALRLRPACGLRAPGPVAGALQRQLAVCRRFRSA